MYCLPCWNLVLNRSVIISPPTVHYYLLPDEYAQQLIYFGGQVQYLGKIRTPTRKWNIQSGWTNARTTSVRFSLEEPFPALYNKPYHPSGRRNTQEKKQDSPKLVSCFISNFPWEIWLKLDPLREERESEITNTSDEEG